MKRNENIYIYNTVACRRLELPVETVGETGELSAWASLDYPDGCRVNNSGKFIERRTNVCSVG